MQSKFVLRLQPTYMGNRKHYMILKTYLLQTLKYSSYDFEQLLKATNKFCFQGIVWENPVKYFPLIHFPCSTPTHPGGVPIIQTSGDWPDNVWDNPLQLGKKMRFTLPYYLSDNPLTYSLAFESKHKALSALFSLSLIKSHLRSL